MESDTDSVEDAQDALQLTELKVSTNAAAELEQPKLAGKSWRRNGIINNKATQCERLMTKDVKSNKNMNSQGQLQAQLKGMDGGHQNVDKSKGRVDSQQAAHSDELRISKILRRLLSENNGSKASELCDKLEIAVRAPINTAYICRSFDYIMDSMLQLLKHCPGQALNKCSEIMGLLGYINHNDFAVYKNYITKAYQNNKELKNYLMLALRTTIKADRSHLHLLVYSDRLLTVLKDYLENAEQADNFIAVGETIAQFSENYIRSFENHFTDVVDIIVGWHLETDQPQSLKLHCSAMLQHFSVYFLKALNFTFRLLGQFLEDLMLMGEELNMEKTTLEQKQKVELRMGAFVGAFTSIIKALSIKQEFTVWSVGHQILNDAFIVILELFIKILNLNLATEDTILQINDYLYFIFSHKYQHQQHVQVQHVIMLQLQHLKTSSKKEISSVFCLILSVIRQQRTQLPCKMVQLLFEPTEENNLMQFQLHQDAKLYRLLLNIYQEVLLIKNVPLLQEAYKHIKLDIETNMRLLKEKKTADLGKAQIKLSFYLSALCVLATQTSSIIGMYALNPSILELLIVNFCTVDLSLWSKYMMLHGALIELLIEHCQKNHNFRTSSRLLQVINDENKSSPTSENFVQILKFLADMLIQHQLLRAETLKRLLNWLYSLLQELDIIHFSILLQQTEFQQICLSLSQLTQQAPILSRKCMICLLQKHVDLPSNMLLSWRDVALQNLDSLNADLQKYIMELLGHLPVQIIMIKDNNAYEQHVNKLNELQYWYKSNATTTQLQAKYIKPFLEALDYSATCSCQLELISMFSNIFTNNWILLQREKHLEYEQATSSSFILLCKWLQQEVARFCVRNKLRTPLGKPQDTFLGIEAVIMQYARLFGSQITETQDTLEKRIFLHTKVRLLLDFLEFLEKHIFNAAEGTAFALQPVEKSAKTFFRINTPTCNSWLTRIRNSTQLMATHTLQPHMVIRFSQITALTNETALIMLAKALVSCGESDMLQGLYAWLKGKTGQRHMFLQYAAAQANGNTETASEGYLLLLNDKHSKLSKQVQEFVEQQLISCMYNNGNWQQMQECQFAEMNKQFNINHLKTLQELVFGDTSINVACGIQSESAYNAITELITWNEEIEDNSYSFDKIVDSLEQNCIKHLLKVDNQNLPDNLLQAVQQVTNDSLMHDLPQAQELLLLNKVAEVLHKGDFNMQLHFMHDNNNSKVLLKSLIWTLLFQMRQHVTAQTHAITCANYLNLAKNARCEGNKEFAMNLLQRFFELKGYKGSFKEQALEFNINYQNEQMLQACDELAQCLWSTNALQMNSINLSAKICNQLMETQTVTSYSSKMLITLADWIPLRSNVELVACEPLQQLLKHLPELTASSEVQMPATDKAVGKLLQASIMQARASPEAWNVFGSWCYRWGKKLVEYKNDGGKLSQTDMCNICQILGGEVPSATLQELLAVLNNLQLNDAVEDIETSEISTNEMLEIELRKLNILANRPVEQINSIIEIWRNAHKNVFAYYELAAKAYFKYLAIEAEQSTLSDASFVTITLRILRLVVKHAIGLQDTLEEGLQNTPLRPWRTIIPQLFSRLNHHELYVRKSVAELLCRLAKHRPHLVIFPAVVGAQQELNDSVDNKQLKCCFSHLLGTLQQQAPDTVLHVQLLVKELKRVALLWEEHWMNALAQLYAEYTPLFSNFEAEVKKSGLNRSQAETRRLQAKYALLMQHVLTDFRKIANSTAKNAETNYERNFQERYEALIESTVSSLQEPLNFNKPNEHWLNIKQLYNALQQRALRNTASTLKIQDLSPVLANMRDTAISMPGVDNYASEEHIYIKAVESAVFVLPTKTKPKKLSFLGSDGRKYTYLFKGLEDLHLDERIMQFLAITNAMMARAATDNVVNNTNFQAHHYSVIPLGPQSGLISWVDGVTPLFSIYKKWQQRDALLKQQQKERPNGKQEQLQPTAVVTRPSEIFYNKLTPLLAEQNIKITDPRKQWPLATLRRVLTELSQETPRDLLSKELWCYANSAADWRKAVRCYTQSVAVMSVIGYVIGLGDRHLDNVLIKLSTGEIVHIDYNVCFEKGKTLRVPEKVPFRMTPNIEDALGVTGVEGAFRLGCEHVLKTLRKERETLLTLLEAFVYDPLMDWTVGDDGSATATRTTSAHAAAQALATLNEVNQSATGKEEVQKPTDLIWRKEDWQTTKQNIQLRLNELKPSWIKYKEEMCAEFIRIDGNIMQLMRKREDLAITERQRSNISKETALINELQALGSAQGSHALNTISQRYAVYKQTAETFNNVKIRVQQCQHDYEQLGQLYFNGLLNNEKLCLLKMQLHQLQQQQQTLHVNEYDMLQAILEENGHKQLYDLYDFTRKEMDNTLVQQLTTSLICVKQLMQYANIIKKTSHKLIAEKRCFKYAQWFQKLLDEEVTADILLQESSKYKEAEITSLQSELPLLYNKAMEQKWFSLNCEYECGIMDINFFKTKEIMPVDLAINSLRGFVSINTSLHLQAVQISLSQMLQKTNKAFLQYEQNAFKQGECNLLEQQMNYIEMFKTVCQTVFDEMSPLLQQRYEALTTLHELLQSLLQLQTDLEISLPNQIIQLYMWYDDNENYISALEILCRSTESAEELQFTNCADLIACLEKLKFHFSTIEIKIMELQRIEREIMDTAEASVYKEVASEKLFSVFCLQSLRNEATRKLFVAGRQIATSIKKNDLSNVYDINQLLEPIRQYVKNLQTHCLLGTTAFFCHELSLVCAQQLDLQVKDTLDETMLSNSSVHCQNLVIALQHATTLKNQRAQNLLYVNYEEHYSEVCSAHFWMNNLQDETARHILKKHLALNNLQNTYQRLEVWQKTVYKIQQDIEEHTATVLQMPLIERFHLNFYEIVQQKVAQLAAQQQTCKQLMEYVNVLLRFESINAQSDDDVNLQALLKQWQDAYNIWRQAGAAISPIERDIVQLLDPEGKVDQCWIDNITGLLDDMSYSVQRQLANIEREDQMLQEILQADGLQVQQFIEGAVRVEMRHLLKSIGKLDKQPRNANTEISGLVARVRDLQHKLKLLYNKLAEFQMKLTAKDFSESALVKLKERVVELLMMIEDRHADFMQIVQRSLNNSLTSSPLKINAVNTDCETVDNMGGNAIEKDKKLIINRQQKRNAYAVSVWKRIRMKLEGRDPDPNRRSNINEQVDYIIHEAMHVDNLAVLYEGWTPWV